MNLNPFKTIYFVWERWGGGCTMGCYQPLLSCIDLNINARSINRRQLLNEINKIKDSLIFIFKFKPTQNEINVLKNNKNTVLRYVGDGLIRNEINYHVKMLNIDGIIVGSRAFKKIIDANQKIKSITTVIPANHDYFLENKIYQKERSNTFRLFFGGSRDPSGIETQGELGLSGHDHHEGYFHSLFHMFENMKNQSEENLRKYLISAKDCNYLNQLKSSNSNPSRYSCHYGVRSPTIFSVAGQKINYEQWVTKTGGKVSTAAACGSNIITSLDPSVRELIDESYPYAINTEKSGFIDNYKEICSEMINKARITFGKKEWKEGLKIMNDVKEKTTTQVITKRYIEFGINCYQK